MCLRKGHPCPGYQRSLRWSTKHERRFEDSSIFLPSTPPHRSGVDVTSNTAAGDDANEPNTVTVEGVAQPVEGLAGELSAATCWFPWGDADAPCDIRNFESRNSGPAFLATLESPFSPVFTTAEAPDRLDLDGFSVPAASTAFSRTTGLGFLDAENALDRENHSNKLPALVSQGSSISQITDLPSFLITTWFNHICPMWSAFDSDANMNRKIVLECWSSNEAIFYSLQSMAAAYMIDSLPHLASMAKLSTRRAVQTIKVDLAVSLASQDIDRIPVGLALSLICLGTSLCWTDSKEIGSAFLRQTKKLLQHLNLFSVSLQVQERERLSFLNHSCFYWDMLCRTVSGDEEIGPSWQLYQDPGDWTTQSIPHPWTGISAITQRFFASAISICRKFHAREKRPHKISGSSLRGSLQDIEDASSLEQQIRIFQGSSQSDQLNTGDICTPGSHLVSVAEAYRLAALLQLYETFDDLATPKDLHPVVSGKQGGASDCRRLSTTFNLLQILEGIPSNSGSRSIQPILYITASIGLRFRNTSNTTIIESDPFKETSLADMIGLESSPSSSSMADWLSTGSDTTLSTDVRISKARHFVMTRFSALEQSLPSRPIKIAKALVSEIWASYDSFPNETHWLDVMQRTGLYTIFG
ncbi:fungal-specific transcription factor domain-containing protein [Penicillium cataractarum]|uniref:Fungal-specific transcription factor domain-containing protein n=1 Tax=Penicillium cataractarum TaxID=2100454 RepID=A0A9W9RT18_9EURO|nr:fungal-specific transcription factor domain-containing protein [Penicillium cataractarum]KAJ5364489.1 fungal-specific transcription factor domain-containing protein [Penicillium cataractarum]